MAKGLDIEVCEANCTHRGSIDKALSNMPDMDTISALADFYKVFGDGTRMRILCALQEGELCVCDLAEALSMTQSAISHQLRVLKQMKLVKNKREGKVVYYALSDNHIYGIISQGLEHVRE
jgi:ArsR family transcriptional regulator